MKKRILSIALSVAMLASAFVFPTSAAEAGDVLLYYNFNDIQDGVVADMSGNGFDGQLTAAATDNGDGTVTFSDAGLDGGMSFPAEVFAGTTDLTMEFYINQPTYRQTTNLMSYGSDADHLMTVLLGHDNIAYPRLAICNGSERDGQEKFYCKQPINQGEWTLITFVISDGKLTRYIDGVEYGSCNVDQNDNDGTITMTPADIFATAVENGVEENIACKLAAPTAWPDPGFAGTIGAFKILGAAITEDEAVAEYEAFEAGEDGITNDENGGNGGDDVTVSGITLNSSALTLTAGKTAELKATLAPAGATGRVTWASSSDAVATVVNGKVTAVKAGTAVITASLASNPSIKATCTVTVNDPMPVITTVKLNAHKAILSVKQTKQLKATVSPAGKVLWESSDPTVASVSQTGKVTAKKAGVVLIAASSGLGADICAIQVNPVKASKVKLAKKGKTLTVKFKKGAGAKYAEITLLRNNKKVKIAKNVKKTSYKFKAAKKGTYKVKVVSCAKYAGAVLKSKAVKSKAVKVK